jgi:glycosyltransferase involved in cell wall biosynthesis
MEKFTMITSETRLTEPLESGRLDIAAVILTYNEEIHIARSIASVRDLVREVLVLDSFSSDRTTEIARASGARVLQNKFINYSKQFQWALDNGGISSAWILRLDADEVIEEDLSHELRIRLPALPSSVVGVNFDRKHIFMGRWIKHGGRYPLKLLRLWRRENGRIEERWMDEHIVVWGGETTDIKGGFADMNENDLTFFIDKHNKYATREAIDVLIRRHGLFESDEAFKAKAVSLQAAGKRWIKENVYNRMPFWAGPFSYFLYRYAFQLGFLDGRPGLIYHFLQGFWYRFLVGAKVEELESALVGCRTNDERIERLSRLTGHGLMA